MHRLERKQQKGTPRGIIVRFVSRRNRDLVIYSRKKLRGIGIFIAEDLSPRRYALLCNVKVCKLAWSVNGKICMKAWNDRIVQVKHLSDLCNLVSLAQWSQAKQPHLSSATDRPRGGGGDGGRYARGSQQENGAEVAMTDDPATRL